MTKTCEGREEKYLKGKTKAGTWKRKIVHQIRDSTGGTKQKKVKIIPSVSAFLS